MYMCGKQTYMNVMSQKHLQSRHKTIRMREANFKQPGNHSVRSMEKRIEHLERSKIYKQPEEEMLKLRRV